MPILPDPLLHADMQVSAEVETPSAPFEKRVLVRLHGLVHAKPQLGVPQRLLAHLRTRSIQGQILPAGDGFLAVSRKALGRDPFPLLRGKPRARPRKKRSAWWWWCGACFDRPGALGVEALCELAQRFAPLHRRFV